MFTGNNWSKIARNGPINPQTGMRYHPQTLARVARGEVKNVMLLEYLTKIGAMQHAKAKKINKSTRNETRTRTGKSRVQHDSGKITEISECIKAIRQEAYSYPTDKDHEKRD